MKCNKTFSCLTTTNNTQYRRKSATNMSGCFREPAVIFNGRFYQLQLATVWRNVHAELTFSYNGCLLSQNMSKFRTYTHPVCMHITWKFHRDPAKKFPSVEQKRGRNFPILTASGPTSHTPEPTALKLSEYLIRCLLTTGVWRHRRLLGRRFGAYKVSVEHEQTSRFRLRFTVLMFLNDTSWQP